MKCKVLIVLLILICIVAFSFSFYIIFNDFQEKEESNNIKQLNFDERIDYYKKASKITIKSDEKITKIVKLSTCSYLNAKTSPTDQRYYIIAYLESI